MERVSRAHMLVGFSAAVVLMACGPEAELGQGLEEAGVGEQGLTTLTARKVVLGADFTCALTTTGGVRCWGSNASGQLGNGTTTMSSRPVNVSGLTSGVIDIATGRAHACALLSSGAVRCWGSGTSGQLGNNVTSSSTPVAVSGFASGGTALVAGDSHTCAIRSGGVVCWGANGNGQLGNGTRVDSPVPVAVSGLSSGVSRLAGGANHNCAVLSTGAVRCWGYNFYGNCGNGATGVAAQTTPVSVSTLASGVTQVTISNNVNCAVQSGVPRCWGYDTVGLMGTAVGISTVFAPTQIPFYSTVRDVSLGSGFICALTTANTEQCWGNNSHGELGINSSSFTISSPQTVGLSSTTIALGILGRSANHNCALDNSVVKCQGSNASGQLGNGTTTDSRIPVVVQY